MSSARLLRRRSLRPLVAVASLLGAARAGAQSPADAQIRAVLDSTAAGWNRGDLSRYLWAYADTATSMGSNGPERGRAAIEAQMRAGFWRTGRPLQSLHYEHVDVRMLGAAHALVTGEFVLTGGGRPARTGWFTTVWAHTADGWRMIHDHSG